MERILVACKTARTTSNLEKRATRMIGKKKPLEMGKRKRMREGFKNPTQMRAAGNTGSCPVQKNNMVLETYRGR